MNDDNALLVGGAGFTAATLAAGHWFPHWIRLTKLQSYAFGTLAILLGQGIYMRFNRRWLKLCLIAAIGGATVFTAYRHDYRKRRRVQAVAGGQHNGLQQTG